MPTVTVIQPKISDGTQRLLRVAAYCRVSSSSDDQLNSYNSQLTYYTHKFEGSETETLIDIYADEGITGTCEEKRTEFLSLIEDCRKGKIDRIYTKSISRFARNTRDCLKNIRELKSLGITILFEKENIDTANINDELMITIMGGLAQEESVSISQNMKWSYRRRCKNGKVKASRAPFGYDNVNGQLVVNEKEATVVKEIFDMFLSGIGYQRISDYCNKCFKGYKESFSFDGIRYILTNEKYIGDSLFQKFYKSDSLPFRKMTNYGQLDQYYYDNTHDSIITREQFNAVQVIIQSRKSTGYTINRAFSSKIKCGLCGTTYKFKMCNEHQCWSCRKHDKQAENCNNRIVKGVDIENAFIQLFNKFYGNYHQIFLPIQDSLQELEIKQSSGNTNLIELRRSVFQLKEQLKVIATLRTKGFLNEAKYKEQSAEINNKISKLNRELRLLSQSENTTLKDIEMLINYFKNRSGIMIDFEPEAFEFLIDKIIVNDNILEFHMIGGLIFSEEI